jgi:hypothetical protein
MSTDTDRMDWLESADVCAMFWGPQNGWTIGRNEPQEIAAGMTLREAIDLARLLDPLPLVCRTCSGSGWVGRGEDADDCGVCEGRGRLPLMGWRRFLPLKKRRELEKLFAGTEL